MMHQIRKMVGMAALCVRCGTDSEKLIPQTVQGSKREDGVQISIPKAPGLGLLLERPVFESYAKTAQKFEKEPINFEKYEKEMEEFKQRQIYQTMFQTEEEEHP